MFCRTILSGGLLQVNVFAKCRVSCSEVGGEATCRFIDLDSEVRRVGMIGDGRRHLLLVSGRYVFPLVVPSHVSYACYVSARDSIKVVTRCVSFPRTSGMRLGQPRRGCVQEADA